ncbi:MAG: outer membrane protein assembly factor BamD [Nitrospirae bacterium]|nr:outer membrane protein assembly factor BamD [Nitrospirota bacterium]
MYKVIMRSKTFAVSSAVVLLSAALLFNGCAGSNKTDTLSKTDGLTDSLRELYDADTLIKKADKLFKEKDYPGAIQEYKRFLELHPIHKSASYSQYRIGLSYFKQIKSIDRDIEPVQKAMTAFDTVIKVYPNSDYISDSTEKMKICRDRLAEREFYIGNFYLHKEDYQAAIVRFNNVLSDYNGSSVAEKTLYHLGVAYSSSSKADKAREILQSLLTVYPESRYKEDASQLLAKLNGN